ncbi:biotin--[acetyl-CoA-carboxylase] ligase BPL1 Ecym_8066 [Eremothecium cymbalariae DBVPG|uniref:BPL/LPL catalytic domain-containing protein n=1 Tax=Eremothecium cymbalariae (strain CBS 270.75 / DBVPG 7215 / KCTC 17166 / NRRL Y-17582) TaxID=931890 RepID=G8JWY8_ERECY|nr:Hypothetical protein Ecym_8066 [Eremothecium cymbalariae DBVPG\
MNVYIYNGPGTSSESVSQTVTILRHFLEPYYAVSTISPRSLSNEAWYSKTSALVFPGGADIPYVKACKSATALIKKFVSKQGGIYIGICAGSYFGSGRVEFDVDGPLGVVGNRDLQFFPGIARGPAFRGFEYNSEAGARAPILKPSNADGEEFAVYFNGGPVFVDAHKYANVEILAEYQEDLDVPCSDDIDSAQIPSAASVILCKVGKGKALLSGAHFEFNPGLLMTSQRKDDKRKIIDTLKEHEKARLAFLREILIKAGLRFNTSRLSSQIPSLTPLVACSVHNGQLLHQFAESLKGESTKEGNRFEFKSNADTFHLYQGFSAYESTRDDLRDKDLNIVIKPLLIGTDHDMLPSPALTPNFDIKKYFDNLNADTSLGSILLYGEVVTSTSTLLDSNKTLLHKMPENSVLFVSTLQVAGRGRGNNVWVNPRGVSASTVCINLPVVSPRTGDKISIAFVQYLSMLAYCEAILSYAPGFEDIPIRIKWPNDMYALDPEYYRRNDIKLVGKGIKSNIIPLSEVERVYVKISGMLVNSNFINNKYSLLIGCGINLFNEAPTTSVMTWVNILNKERALVDLDPLPKIEIERLLALYMTKLGSLISDFINYGPKLALPRYYRLWLHSGQIVHLQDYNNTRAMITGITSDYGLLIARELKQGSDNEFTGLEYTLQPDGNSFDIFKGLISKKLT